MKLLAFNGIKFNTASGPRTLIAAPIAYSASFFDAKL